MLVVIAPVTAAKEERLHCRPAVAQLAAACRWSPVPDLVAKAETCSSALLIVLVLEIAVMSPSGVATLQAALPAALRSVQVRRPGEQLANCP